MDLIITKTGERYKDFYSTKEVRWVKMLQELAHMDEVVSFEDALFDEIYTQENTLLDKEYKFKDTTVTLKAKDGLHEITVETKVTDTLSMRLDTFACTVSDYNDWSDLLNGVLTHDDDWSCTSAMWMLTEMQEEQA